MESATATDQARDQVQEKAQVAQEKAKEGAQQAKSRITTEVDTRSTQAGEQVSSTAEALRSTSQQLREKGSEPQAKAVERAAEQAERLGGYLTDKSGDDILYDLEDLGRRQPLAVVASGVVLGFAAARFLKASGQKRYEQRTERLYGGTPSYSSDRGFDDPTGVRPTGGAAVGRERAREVPPAAPPLPPAPGTLGQGVGASNPGSAGGGL